MSEHLDTSFVDLHRLPSGSHVVQRLQGRAFRVTAAGEDPSPLRDGSSIEIGQTIVIEGGGTVTVAGLTLAGGLRGRAHSFVGEDAFQTTPRREDVPRLLTQLTQIETAMESLGADPLAMQEGPKTPGEKAAAAEFAFMNIVPAAAQSLPEAVARKVRSVCLFFSSDAAFVAASTMSVPKLRILMEALRRPINPHLVDESVVDELLERVYGQRRPS